MTLDSNPSPKSGCVKEHPVRVININGKLHSLNRPVLLQVKNKGDTYFAENDLLEICGYMLKKKAASPASKENTAAPSNGRK